MPGLDLPRPVSRETDITSKEMLNLVGIARGVVATPERYDFKLVCEAAGLLAKYDRVALPSLVAELERAGIEA